jgi:hypothetical protein
MLIIPLALVWKPHILPSFLDPSSTGELRHLLLFILLFYQKVCVSRSVFSATDRTICLRMGYREQV